MVRPMTEDQFWLKVDKKGPNDCWNWQGYKVGGGYGRTYFDRKQILAHRLVLIYEGTDIPSGMIVCHTCDNPSCVNPDHLFLGMDADNTKDKIRKGRNGVKLTANQVRKIKKSLNEGVGTTALGRKYGVTASAINLIKTGANWKHI